MFDDRFTYVLITYIYVNFHFCEPMLGPVTVLSE